MWQAGCRTAYGKATERHTKLPAASGSALDSGTVVSGDLGLCRGKEHDTEVFGTVIIAVTIAWLIAQVVLIVRGFVILGKRHRVLAILLGLLSTMWIPFIFGMFSLLGRGYRALAVLLGLVSLGVIPPAYAIGDLVSHRYSRALSSTPWAITIGIAIVYFGLPILLAIICFGLPILL